MENFPFEITDKNFDFLKLLEALKGSCMNNVVDYLPLIPEEKQKPFKEIEEVFENIAFNFPLSSMKVNFCLIKDASKEERKTKGLLSRNLIYGEIVKFV